MGFFLGKDSATGAPVDYTPKHLTTHGLIFGMTGSGKTGLALGFLEEAQRHKIPVIAIDPKGDLGNLALCWPDLSPRHFAPWIDPSRLDGQSPLDAAQPLADTWKNGLEKDGLGPSQIQEMRASSHVAIYTPGSTAGIPVSILDRFEPPAGYAALPEEDKSELVGGVVAALLALVKINADPLQSREYILLANLMREAWARNESLDLPRLVQRVSEPPFSKLGVFELDEFFPPRKRKDFAMQLNGLIASPSFQAWRDGVPLDIDRMLRKEAAGSRTSIFSIAHLDDDERMSFVTLLLDRVIAWMRAQPGTGELRAILYMDEVFGYLPPHPANPPTKRPILTLLKQARAFGLGVLLATQNPVDVDYKSLTNAGTWLIGKLQTDQDKERILDGLMSAQTTDTQVSRSDMSRRISALEGRQFVLQNAHTPDQITFKTRFCMSYLRGPLTRQEIGRLRDADFFNLASTSSLAPPSLSTAPTPTPTPTPAPSPTPAPTPSAAPAPRPAPTPSYAPTPPRDRPDPYPTTIRHLDTRYLQPAMLSRQAVLADLGTNPSPASAPPLYRPALFASVRKSLRIDGWTRLGAQAPGQTLDLGESHWLAFPLSDSLDKADVLSSISNLPTWLGAGGQSPSGLTWRKIDGFALGELSLTSEPGYEHVPMPAWCHSPADRERAKDLLMRQLATHERVPVPVCPPLLSHGEPYESLQSFQTRLAAHISRASDNAIGKLAGSRDQQASLFDKKLAELKQLLEMDKNELAMLKNLGDTEGFKRAQDRARFRLDKYKELQAQREKFVGLAQREVADVEFSALDKLEAVELRELAIDQRHLSVYRLGLLWVPNR